MQKDLETLSSKETHPHIIVATPGRLNALVREKKLRLGNIKVFVLDECDKMLDQIGAIPSFITPTDLTETWNRHETRRTRHFPGHADSKAGHDVFGNIVPGDSTNLQEIHAEPLGNLC